MNKKTLVSFVTVAVLVGAGAVAQAGNPKVTICHVPPGDPGAAHTISVKQSAVGAHLAHGDVLGECSVGCEADPAAEAAEGSCPHVADGDCAASDTAKTCRQNAATCGDQLDNDCDGLLDGDDPDCWYCGDGIVQNATTPGACVITGNVVEQCDDGNDNPFDGCDHCALVDITPD